MPCTSSKVFAIISFVLLVHEAHSHFSFSEEIRRGSGVNVFFAEADIDGRQRSRDYERCLTNAHDSVGTISLTPCDMESTQMWCLNSDNTVQANGTKLCIEQIDTNDYSASIPILLPCNAANPRQKWNRISNIASGLLFGVKNSQEGKCIKSIGREEEGVEMAKCSLKKNSRQIWKIRHVSS